MSDNPSVLPAATGLAALLDRLRAVAARPIAEAVALPPACYTDPAFYALERERIFAREWLCLGRGADMAAPGDYLTLDIPSLASIMAVRQRDGSIKALSRVCRHRAALLGEAGGGHVKLFVCPYHNWVYDLDGTLRGAPTMTKNPAFDRKACTLPAYRCEEWEGFVFVNLDPHAAPLSPRLADISQRAARYGLADMKTAFIVEDVWDTNWKVPFENGTETYHHIGVHKETLEPYFPGLGTVCEPGGPGYNLHVVPTAKDHRFSDVPADRPDTSTLNPDLGAEELAGFLIVGIYPTLAIVFAGAHTVWFTFNPLGPEHTHVRVGRISPAAYLQGPDIDARMKEDRARLEEIIREDRVSCTGVQRGLQTRDAVCGPLSPLELTVAEFGRYLARRLLDD
ncbi:MAG TPA: aromatic ring-hydroxylating dioxygenase subunit alpha [Vineibacter sp.]|nr:aromatic ring-hydroxylating dioxygenase subunit alpha [Vineibacter sp.]